jgi:hypothetical protein
VGYAERSNLDTSTTSASSRVAEVVNPQHTAVGSKEVIEAAVHFGAIELSEQRLDSGFEMADATLALWVARGLTDAASAQ